MKNCTKHFWREKARAPVNVCPFRNRLFCIRSDIHCDTGKKQNELKISTLNNDWLCNFYAQADLTLYCLFVIGQIFLDATSFQIMYDFLVKFVPQVTDKISYIMCLRCFFVFQSSFLQR